MKHTERIMPQSKDIQEQLRNKVIDMNHSGRGLHVPQQVTRKKYLYKFTDKEGDDI